MFRRVNQYLAYLNAIKAGFIVEKVVNGQSIWFIKNDAPDKVKSLGEQLVKIQIEILYITWGIKMFCWFSILALALKYFGLIE
ncbi:hypothetical protein [Pseudoalteromonas galatheae]|uniref:hypothetical protein n=1 Tax=Pseudoalteromonas galatheae TaxID=579562 RepID=UPI0030CD1803